MGAARHWARGGALNQPAFAVYAENWENVQAFLVCSTQWRVAPMGGLIGLDYAGCKAALKAVGTPFKRVFSAIQQMEVAVLRVLAEASRQSGATTRRASRS